MYEIHVSTTVAADLQRVFNTVADHEQFLRDEGLSCRLVAEGREERNGVGAVREVTADGLVFTEEITAFDPPRHYEYVIRKLVNGQGKPVRLRHERGWIDFSPQGEATRVDWHTRFEIPIPIVGWFLERISGPRAARGFRQTLERTKAELEGRLGDEEELSAERSQRSD